MITNLNLKRTAFVFIEFQNAWIGEGARLAKFLVEDRDAFYPAVGNAEKIINGARKAGCLIAHAGLDMRDDPQYLLWGRGEGKLGLAGAVPRAGTWTTENDVAFVEPFVPQAGEFIVKGRSGASVFKNSNLDPFLRNNDVENVVLLGFALHVCVESSLREAHDIGYNAYVAVDACGAFNLAQSEYFSKHIIRHFGLNLESEALISLF